MSESGPDKPASPEAFPRRVRSFVRRPGRMTSAQRRALDEWLPKYSISPDCSDLRTSFSSEAPLVAEIGCGNGDAMVWMAANEPDKNFIAIEVHEPGVGRLLRGLVSNHLTNVRVAVLDAVEVLRKHTVKSSIDELRIYFPDPWPKKRHHKRRLIQPGFVDLAVRVIKPGGLLHLATDWQPYAEWIRDVLSDQPLFEDISTPDFARPHWRPQTHFERRGMRMGHAIDDLIYRKRSC